MRFAAMLLLVSCGALDAELTPTGPAQTPADDRECREDHDCVLVPDATPCGCVCTWRAIPVAEQAEFEAWWDEENADCPPIQCPACLTGPMAAICDGGNCLAVPDGGSGAVLPPD